MTATLLVIAIATILVLAVVVAMLLRGSRNATSRPLVESVMPGPVSAIQDFAVRLTYRDAEGHVTERDVVVKELEVTTGDGVPVPILHGLCGQLGKPRSFRLDRIIGATDPGTGAVIPDLGVALQAHMAAPAGS